VKLNPGGQMFHLRAAQLTLRHLIDITLSLCQEFHCRVAANGNIWCGFYQNIGKVWLV